MLETTSQARAQAWQAFGAVDDDVLTHLINPALMGGPRWPAMRQAYRVARDGSALLLASDGLSDPFDEGTGPQDANGFGLEFFAIAPVAPVPVPGSWLWDIVWQMSNFAANHGGIGALVAEMGLLSTELYDVGIPEAYREAFVSDAGRVGVLLGGPGDKVAASCQGPLGTVALINIKLLRLEELAVCATDGDPGRARVGAGLAAQGSAAHSWLDRAPVARPE